MDVWNSHTNLWYDYAQIAERCNEKVKQFEDIERMAQLVSKIKFGDTKQVRIPDKYAWNRDFN